MPDTGYVYLTLSELQEICLVHLISGMDEERPAFPFEGAVPTAITGYTEWISDGQRVVTIGWDWQMQCDSDEIKLKRISEPSSNVVLQTPGRENLSAPLTTNLLEDFIDTFSWQSQALAHICNRYNA
ncbi:MAG: DUF4902 domain-containing protein [Pseudomonadota bacterium]